MSASNGIITIDKGGEEHPNQGTGPGYQQTSARHYANYFVSLRSIFKLSSLTIDADIYGGRLVFPFFFFNEVAKYSQGLSIVNKVYFM